MKQDAVTFCIGFIFILLCVLIQVQLNFSGDVSYLLFALKQLLNGGVYGREIFETNPPMILYLYAPPFLLHQSFEVSLIVAMRLYFIVLGALSAAVCFYLIKKYISIPLLRTLIMTILFFAFYILPLQEFAQREHFYMIVLFPYLFLSVLRLEKINVKPLLALLIGLFAAFGFALKPFFLIVLLLIEGLLFYKKACFNVELITILVVLMLYVLSIFNFQPEYVHVMLPWVSQYYFPFARQSVSAFFSPPYVLFTIATAFSYIFFYAFDRYRSLGLIIWLALIGTIFAFCLARTSWYYHVIPALALSYLLIIFYIGQSYSTYKGACMSAVFIFMIPFYNLFLMLHYGLETRQSFKKMARIIQDKKTIICFPLGTRDCFPLMDMTRAEYGSRFPSLWWFKGLRQLENKAMTAEIIRDKAYFTCQLGFDLAYSKADFLIFNNAIFPANDVIAYLQQNKNFKEAFRKYDLKYQFREYEIYQKKLSS